LADLLPTSSGKLCILSRHSIHQNNPVGLIIRVMIHPTCQSSETDPRVDATAPPKILDVLELPPMSKQKLVEWQRFGDLVYGAGKGAFETSWP